MSSGKELRILGEIYMRYSFKNLCKRSQASGILNVEILENIGKTGGSRGEVNLSGGC